METSQNKMKKMPRNRCVQLLLVPVLLVLVSVSMIANLEAAETGRQGVAGDWPSVDKYEPPVIAQRQESQTTSEATSTQSIPQAADEISPSSSPQPEELTSSISDAATQQATIATETTTAAAPLEQVAVEQRSISDNDLFAVRPSGEQFVGGSGGILKSSESSSKSRQSMGKRWPGAAVSVGPVFGRKRQRKSEGASTGGPGELVEEPSSRAAARHFYQAALESSARAVSQQQTTRRQQMSSSRQTGVALEQPEVSEILIQQEPTRISSQQIQQQQVQLDSAELNGEQEAAGPQSVVELQTTTTGAPVGQEEKKSSPFIRLSNVATLSSTANGTSPTSGSPNDTQQMKLMRIYVIDLDQKLVVGDTGLGQQPLQSLNSLQALQSLQLSQPAPEVADKRQVVAEQVAPSQPQQARQRSTEAPANYSSREPAEQASGTSYELAGDPVAYVPEGYVLLERDSLQANLNQVVAQLESSNRTSAVSRPDSLQSAVQEQANLSVGLAPRQAVEQVVPQYRAPQYWAAPGELAHFNQTTIGGPSQLQLPRRQSQVKEQQQVSSVRATRQQLDYWPTRAADTAEPAPQNYYHHGASVSISEPSPALQLHYSETPSSPAAYSLRVTAPPSPASSGSGDQWRPVDYSHQPQTQPQQHWQVSAEAGSGPAQPPYANKLSAGLLNGPRTAASSSYSPADPGSASFEQPTWDNNRQLLQHQLLGANETGPAPVDAQHAPHSNRTTSHQQVRAGPHPSSQARGYGPEAAADSGTTTGASSEYSAELERPSKPRRPFASGSLTASEAPRIPQPLKPSSHQQHHHYQLYKASASADSGAGGPSSAYMSVSGPPVPGGGVYESQTGQSEADATELAHHEANSSRRPPHRRPHRRPASYSVHKSRPQHRRPSPSEPVSNELYSSASDDHYPDFRPPSHAPSSHHYQHHMRPTYAGPKGLLSWETLSSVASGAAKRLPSLSSLLVPFGGGPMGRPSSSYPTANQQQAAPMHLRGLHYDREVAAAFHRPYPFKFMAGSSGSGPGAGQQRQPSISYQEEPSEEVVDQLTMDEQPPQGAVSVAGGESGAGESTGLPDVDAELASVEEQTSTRASGLTVAGKQLARGQRRPVQKLEPAQEAVMASVELDAAEALRNAPSHPAPVRGPNRRPKRPKVAPIVPTLAGELIDEADSASLSPFDALHAEAHHTRHHHHHHHHQQQQQQHQLLEQEESSLAGPVRAPHPAPHPPQSSIQIGQFKLTPQTQFVQSIIEPSRQMLGQYFKQYIGQIGHTLG